MKRLIWLFYASYLLIGFANVIIGASLPELLSYYSRDYREGGLLISMQFAGFLIGVIMTPLWVKRLGHRNALLFALSMLFMAQMVYGFLPSWEWIIVAAPFAGFGFGIVEAIIGALILDSVKEKKAVVMSKVEVFFSIGAMLMPLIVSIFIVINYWNLAFFVLAFFSLIMIFLWIKIGQVDAFIDSPTEDIPNKKDKIIQPSLLNEGTYKSGAQLPLFILFVILFATYVGVEMSIANFLPAILIELSGVSTAVASLSVTFFWIAMSVGRIFAGVIAEKVTYYKYLLWTNIATLLTLIAFSFISGIVGLFVFILIIGLFMSGTFAISLTYANALLSLKTEKITSLLIASGGVGGALVPLLTGWSMEMFSTEVTLWLFASLQLVLLVLIISTDRRKGNHPKGKLEAEVKI
ncbi:MFS transporter [Salipaludibacillus sp. HK11]|uniref:MFS transporter n=1 Tax=Salipaludibacillus sp. HK11 TaxID=3394320 RepID=UPI0039FD54D6